MEKQPKEKVFERDGDVRTDIQADVPTQNFHPISFLESMQIAFFCADVLDLKASFPG